MNHHPTMDRTEELAVRYQQRYLTAEARVAELEELLAEACLWLPPYYAMPKTEAWGTAEALAEKCRAALNGEREAHGAGWTAEEYAKCPEVIARLHRRILDLQDALEASTSSGGGMASESRHSTAIAGEPDERTNDGSLGEYEGPLAKDSLVRTDAPPPVDQPRLKTLFAWIRWHAHSCLRNAEGEPYRRKCRVCGGRVGW